MIFEEVLTINRYTKIYKSETAIPNITDINFPLLVCNSMIAQDNYLGFDCPLAIDKSLQYTRIYSADSQILNRANIPFESGLNSNERYIVWVFRRPNTDKLFFGGQYYKLSRTAS